MSSFTTLFIGIDVSKDNFTLAFKALDDQWTIKVFNNDPAGINQAIELAQASPQDIHVILEATGKYSQKLTYQLCQNNIKVSVLNPKQSKGFISGVLLSTTKTDLQDACALALYGQVNQPKPYQLPSNKQFEINQLRTLYRQLKKQRRTLLNQLHAMEFQVLPLDFVIQTLQQSLTLCQQQIQQTQKRLVDLSKQAFEHAYQLATTVIGVGPAIASAILITTDAFRDFDNPKQVAKFIGVCPTQFESGSSIKGRGSIAKTGDPEVRALLFMGARAAKKYNPSCKELYERLRRKGKCHKVAMTAVSNKLVRQIFAVVKKQIPFDPNFHLIS